MKRIELIMGRNIPDGGRVSDYMMNEFIKQEIIPHFEYGTFIDGEGLWKGEYEKTKIFYIEVADSEAIATAVLLKHIADRYRKQFRQESVLVSEVETATSWITWLPNNSGNLLRNTGGSSPVLAASILFTSGGLRS